MAVCRVDLKGPLSAAMMGWQAQLFKPLNDPAEQQGFLGGRQEMNATLPLHFLFSLPLILLLAFSLLLSPSVFPDFLPLLSILSLPPLQHTHTPTLPLLLSPVFWR